MLVMELYHFDLFKEYNEFTLSNLNEIVNQFSSSLLIAKDKV